MEQKDEFIFIEGDEIEKMIEEWNALPFYKRFVFRIKQFWNMYI